MGGTLKYYDGTEWQPAGQPDPLYAKAIINDMVYPVGSQYVNFTDSSNPAVILGVGTWVAVEGRVVVGLDPLQTEFDTAGETGGAKTHTLTTTEMPSHTHTMGSITLRANVGNYGASQTNLDDIPGSPGPVSATNVQVGNAWSGTMGSSGGGEAHNNLQPYVVAYVWKRTA